MQMLEPWLLKSQRKQDPIKNVHGILCINLWRSFLSSLEQWMLISWAWRKSVVTSINKVRSSGKYCQHSETVIQRGLRLTAKLGNVQDGIGFTGMKRGLKKSWKKAQALRYVTGLGTLKRGRERLLSKCILSCSDDSKIQVTTRDRGRCDVEPAWANWTSYACHTW